MPNGGSDCCGTCWFNKANQDKAGYPKRDSNIENRCDIRDVIVENPFWTYCANHSHHNPNKIELPIGPVYVDSREGFPYRRKVLVDSPDSEEIRKNLIRILESMQEQPIEEYPTSTKLDETVILQLGLFKEKRAVTELRRIMSFDPFARPMRKKALGRNRIPTIAYAIEALAQIVGDECITELKYCLSLGLQAAKKLSPYSYKDDRIAMIRHHAVVALQYVSREKSVELLREAASDPNKEVADVARQLLSPNF
jgi:hypothetical protein